VEVFPETIKPSSPLEIESRYRTVITQFDTGIEFRRRKWRFPRRSVTLKFPYITQEETETLWNFYVARKGSYESFYWFDYLKQNWIDEFVGRGDGTVVTFDLPGKEIDETTLKVYIDGVEQQVGTAGYTFSAGTGVNGEDQIVFSTAPSLGSLITCDFNGRLRLKVRFKDDILTKYRFTNIIQSIGITLFEVR